MTETIAFVVPITWLTGCTTGWGNGYVAIPQGHPLFGVDYSDIESIDIHGGLTYSADKLSAQPKETEGMWIIGFDCAHYGDTPETRPEEFVRAKVESLKKQVDDLAL